jgi:hypothetical protein
MMVRRIINSITTAAATATSTVAAAVLLILTSANLNAQGELDSLLNKELGNETEEVLATFKTTRIINGHSVERVRQGDLDFRIAHRFGTVQGGAYEFFGIDQSTSQFGLEYGVKDYLMVGISRATWQKTTSGLLKVSVLRQRTGEKSFPFSLSYATSVFVNGLKWADDSRNNFFTSRLSYLHQIPIARKFNPSLSLQLTPTLIHRNLAQGDEPNDIYSLGAGGRYKITVRTAIVAEYFHTFRKDLPEMYNDCFSLGFDIETGSHVFQIMLTNSQGMTENNFIVYSTGKWNKGDLFIGFNICRFFTLKSDKKK